MIVEFEIRGRVGLIRLNRPDARNAINRELAEAVETAIDRLEDDDELWVGILCANGPAFSAGADLKAIASGRANLGTARGGFGGLVTRERIKPLIAAVEGPALAGGTELVLACDMVVASTAARFGLPEHPSQELLDLVRRISIQVPQIAALFGVEPTSPPRRRPGRSRARA